MDDKSFTELPNAFCYLYIQACSFSLFLLLLLFFPPPSPFLQGVKYPKNAYRYLQLLLGQKYDSPLVAKYRQWFPFYDMKKDEERGQRMYSEEFSFYLYIT